MAGGRGYSSHRLQRGSTFIKDYISINTETGKALVLERSVERIAKIDGLIFDVDGVLIDVSNSMKIGHIVAAEAYFAHLGWTSVDKLITVNEVDTFRLAGGFNSDWDMGAAYAMLYLLKSVRSGITDGEALKPIQPTLDQFIEEVTQRGGGLETAETILRESCTESEWAKVLSRFSRKEIDQVFMEVYSGDMCPEIYGFEQEIYTGPGLIASDRALLDANLIPKSLKVGVATGRTYGEAVVGLRLMGWEGLFPPSVTVTEDDGYKKPDPEILRFCLERIGCERAIYVGDTPDDLLTARRFDSDGSKMLACMVLSGLDHPALADRFADEHADIIADNVNAALAAIERCMGGLL